MKRTALFLASLGFLLTQLAWTQTAKPDFTGKWAVETLTVESGIAPPPPPGAGKQIIEVEHKEPSLKIGPSRYTTDGKESANAVGNAPSRSKVVWEGKRLVIESQIEIGGNQLKTKETWELSADGKTLTIVKEFSGLTDAKVRMVCKMS